MTDFNPTDHEPDGNDAEFLDKPGKYILAFRKCTDTDKTRSGKRYHRFSTVVIAGKPGGQAGKVLSERVYVSEAALRRLGRFCWSMGVTEPFDPDDALAAANALCRQPFLARVKCNKGSDGETYAEVSGIEAPLEGRHRELADEWIATETAAGNFDEDPWTERVEKKSNDEGGDDWGGSGGGDSGGGGSNDDWGGEKGDPGAAGKSGDFGDDDIPF